MAILMLIPLSLAPGGVFLAFGPTVSGVFFAAFLAQYLLKVYTAGQFKMLPNVFGLAFLTYAVGAGRPAVSRAGQRARCKCPIAQALTTDGTTRVRFRQESEIESTATTRSDLGQSQQGISARNCLPVN